MFDVNWLHLGHCQIIVSLFFLVTISSIVTAQEFLILRCHYEVYPSECLNLW